MKKLTLMIAAAVVCLSAVAQTDTTKSNNKVDTIRIGGMLIVKHGKDSSGAKKDKIIFTLGNENIGHKKKSWVSTSWFTVDLGFSNYIDNTNYANARLYLVNRPGYPAFGESDFKLRTGKSINVNIWIFMQRLKFDRNFYFKYGLGLELNNYRYLSSISYKQSGIIPYTNNSISTSPFIFRDSISFSKNKLAADYFTVPLMLNFVSNPSKIDKGISLSCGVSAGYLYSQRNKQKSNERGKVKNKGDYDLEQFKFSYIAELGLGPVRLYGSYSPNSMYKNSLDIKPYTVGLRLSKW